MDTFHTAAVKLSHRELNTRNDVLTGGIVFAALILFVSTGSQALSATVEYLAGIGGGADRVLAVALVLNIALILFGWRRHHDLTEEVKERRAAETKGSIAREARPADRLLQSSRAGRTGRTDAGASA